MAVLYSCRHDGDQYRITKFDDDMNPESSYLCDAQNCECPAGVRPMCRHREMLPKFLSREAVGTGWMYDYDRGGWVDQRWIVEEPAVEYPSKELQADLDEFLKPQRDIEEQAAIEALPLPPLPEGVQIVSLGDPEKLHNTIAEAVGEPKRKSWRRF